MSKYTPLTEMLIGLPADRNEIAMTFGEIEKLLETELPKTARIDRPWWANTYRNNQGVRWLKAGWKVFSVDLKSEKIVFQRHQGVDNKTVTRSGYVNLKRFFENLPIKQEQIALKFSEFDKIIGRKLPTTAFHDRPWWANTKSSNQGISWLSAGWLVEKVYLKAEIAVFRKKGINPVKRIPKYVKHLLDENTTAKIIDSQTILKWTNFCRRVGWYFEGTVLYERGGLTIDSLTEVDQVAVEEDYSICKREINLHKSLLK